MIRRVLPFILLCCCALARTNIVVQISEDGAQTIPPNAVATPAQVLSVEAAAVAAQTVADTALQRAGDCEEKVGLFSSNYVVTSTVYVQSVGAIMYDPSNQTVKVHSFTVSDTNVVILGTFAQEPLLVPVIDWRQTLGSGGAWSNIEAVSVAQTSIPEGVTNAASAYLFTLPRPEGGSAVFRIVDNSTGASGSGLYWVVFGAIVVDGHKGASCVITNAVGETTNLYRVVGGIIVEPEPLGGM
jgi:hypothetical protein